MNKIFTNKRISCALVYKAIFGRELQIKDSVKCNISTILVLVLVEVVPFLPTILLIAERQLR